VRLLSGSIDALRISPPPGAVVRPRGRRLAGRPHGAEARELSPAKPPRSGARGAMGRHFLSPRARAPRSSKHGTDPIASRHDDRAKQHRPLPLRARRADRRCWSLTCLALRRPGPALSTHERGVTTLAVPPLRFDAPHFLALRSGFFCPRALRRPPERPRHPAAAQGQGEGLTRRAPSAGEAPDRIAQDLLNSSGGRSIRDAGAGGPPGALARIRVSSRWHDAC
jgi:hypothetical protein